MSDEPIALHRADMPSSARGVSWGVNLSTSGGSNFHPDYRDLVRFDHHELKRILDLYGAMVMAGEWRDYAIGFGTDAAVFSVFRRSSEMPLYTIEKRPRQKDGQGQYAILAAGGRVLKRGHDLTAVLRVLQMNLLKLVK